MRDVAGPVGFQHIEEDIIGRWERRAEMKAGGSWFDRDGCYITPGPLFWAPVVPSQDRGSL